MNQTFKVPEFSIKLNSKVKASERVQIRISKDTHDVFKQVFDADTMDWVETMIILALSNNNKVLGFYKISSGGTTGTICDLKIIFQFALLSNATNIIIAHNHPSGNLNPSNADKGLTQKIKEAGMLLDIKLLDHLIITSEGYYSFSDEGLL